MGSGVEVTAADREKAGSLIRHEGFCALWLTRGKPCQCSTRDAVVASVAAALAAERAKARAEVGQCWDKSPAFNVGGLGTLAQARCELPHGHGGAHQHTDSADLPPMRWLEDPPEVSQT